MRPGVFQAIEGLPAHIDRRGGEPTLTPCAEAVLTERAAEAILDRGLMPLLSVQGRDAVILARFQSITDPPAPWRGGGEPRCATRRTRATPRRAMFAAPRWARPRHDGPGSRRDPPRKVSARPCAPPRFSTAFFLPLGLRGLKTLAFQAHFQ